MLQFDSVPPEVISSKRKMKWNAYVPIRLRVTVDELRSSSDLLLSGSVVAEMITVNRKCARHISLQIALPLVKISEVGGKCAPRLEPGW